MTFDYLATQDKRSLDSLVTLLNRQLTLSFDISSFLRDQQDHFASYTQTARIYQEGDFCPVFYSSPEECASQKILEKGLQSGLYRFLDHSVQLAQSSNSSESQKTLLNSRLANNTRDLYHSMMPVYQATALEFQASLQSYLQSLPDQYLMFLLATLLLAMLLMLVFLYPFLVQQTLANNQIKSILDVLPCSSDVSIRVTLNV